MMCQSRSATSPPPAFYEGSVRNGLEREIIEARSGGDEPVALEESHRYGNIWNREYLVRSEPGRTQGAGQTHSGDLGESVPITVDRNGGLDSLPHRPS